ncbi:MAG TPA: hypothetical protein VGJ22_10065 [Anaerolineales bacterium]|jgi:hypothetical protein
MNPRRSFWLLLGLLACIAAATYLPLAGRIGFLKDDWFLVYDAHTQGPGFFHEIYRIDRPARAYVMQAVYGLFGDRLVYYHLSAFAFRVGAAAAMFWSLAMIWPRRTRFNFTAALLFAIYPGFLSQINPFDYQAQLLSLCLAMFSIAFSTKALQVRDAPARLAWTALSILTGIVYPALVEYFLGLEALRLAFVSLVVWNEGRSPWRDFAKRVLRRWLPFAAAPALFLIWRVFFFETERGATDIGGQLGQLFDSPLTGLWWLVYAIQDGLRVVFLAWAVPLYNLALDLRLSDSLIGLALALTVGCAALWGLSRLTREGRAESPDPAESDWRGQALAIGLLAVFFASLPVIVANRHADFGDYSRYTLAGAAGVGMIVAALIESLGSARLRNAAVVFFTFLAALTHYANAVQAAQESEAVRNFWWQVAWRAPAIRPGTTLVAAYPVGIIQEDYFIWGPANLIYYPQQQDVIPIQIQLPAAVLTDDVVLSILTGKGEETPLRRGNALARDFGDVLVLAQSSEQGCVRILDGRAPELSTLDAHRIMLIASHSRSDAAMPDAPSALPPASIFGEEPAHGWCYYYQKASLARQRADWPEVIALLERALESGAYPEDRVEWMPFAQAYAALGRADELRELSKILSASPFLKAQACSILGDMARTDSLSPDVQLVIQQAYCK